LEVYATRSAGIGGRVRARLEDFRVEELLTPGVLEELLAPPENEKGAWLYRLEKRGIDTHHALRLLESRFRVRLHALGLKDAWAVTSQYVVVSNATIGEVAQIGERVSARLIGRLKQPLRRDHLLGNRFTIRVREIKALNDMEAALQEVFEALKEGRIPNFYGYQRFGTSRPYTHRVGEALIKKGVVGALEVLLAPKELGPEEQQAAKALERGATPLQAFRAIPAAIRRLYVQAYQAYLFNRTLSKAVRAGEPLNQVAPKDLAGLLDPETGRIVRVKRVEEPLESAVPVLQLVGYSYRDLGGRFDQLLLEVLEEEEVTPRDFQLKECPELGTPGAIRPAPLRGWDLGHHFDPSERVLELWFSLYRGEYATTLLRELLKPVDPAAAGL
jgi:tRNA pseudouridine13 synthase